MRAMHEARRMARRRRGSRTDAGATAGELVMSSFVQAWARGSAVAQRPGRGVGRPGARARCREGCGRVARRACMAPGEAGRVVRRACTAPGEVGSGSPMGADDEVGKL